MGRIVFILGGARSGKSSWAEKLALELEGEGRSVVYLATCESRPDDREMVDRIARHRERRPSSWRTVEAPFTAVEELGRAGADTVVLLDCLGLWVSNMLHAQEEQEDNGVTDFILARVDELLAAARRSRCALIVVSNETGCGLVPTSRLGRLFRDTLGWANQAVARESDEAWLLVAGLPQRLK